MSIWAQIRSWLSDPAIAWPVCWMLFAGFNWLVRAGSPPDKWAMKHSPRLHGLIIVLRGAFGDFGTIALGIYKALTIGRGDPPPWIVALLPIGLPGEKNPPSALPGAERVTPIDPR